MVNQIAWDNSKLSQTIVSQIYHSLFLVQQPHCPGQSGFSIVHFRIIIIANRSGIRPFAQESALTHRPGREGNASKWERKPLMTAHGADCDLSGELTLPSCAISISLNVDAKIVGAVTVDSGLIFEIYRTFNMRCSFQFRASTFKCAIIDRRRNNCARDCEAYDSLWNIPPASTLELHLRHSLSRRATLIANVNVHHMIRRFRIHFRGKRSNRSRRQRPATGPKETAHYNRRDQFHHGNGFQV